MRIRRKILGKITKSLYISDFEYIHFLYLKCLFSDYISIFCAVVISCY
jgi:hypothetical protein